MRTPRLVDDWFGPTSCHFIVLERTILNAMPEPWQQRFVQVMEDLDDATEPVELPTTYEVRARDERGKECGSTSADSVVADDDPVAQRERAVEFIRSLMVEYAIPLSELDVTANR